MISYNHANMTGIDASIRNLIVDMDGVLWRGETPMEGLQEFFRTLEKLSMSFVLATNNATKTAVQYAEKLARFGVEVSVPRILNSAEATALYLSRSYPPGTTVFVVGESGLRMAMEAQGFSLLNSGGFVGADARADLVVVGFNREACYSDLASATHLINHGARFVGTNPDVTFPSEFGPLPGAGSLLAFIETATGVEPKIVGKPNRAIFEEALRRLKGTPGDTAMVGDRLNTDIVGGHAAGLHTILLLSGITSREDLSLSEIQPDWVFDDLMALTRALAGRDHDPSS